MTVQETAALPAEPLPLDTHAAKPRKKGYWKSSVPIRLDMAQRELYSLTTNEDIRKIFADYSYDQEKINQFVAAYDAARDAQNLQQKEFGDKVGAYDDFEKIYCQAKEDYSTIRKIAKVALRNHPKIANQLGLYDRTGKSVGAIFDAMQIFYNNADDSEFYAVMAKYGYNETRINHIKEIYIQANAARNLFFREDSEAVDATRIRDEKMAILDDWMMDYYSIAKVALANRSEFTTAPDENQQ